MTTIRPKYGRFGPERDYTGAHVIDAQGRLAEIARIYRREVPPAIMAKLRRFNGDDAGEQVLATLELLDRDRT